MANSIYRIQRDINKPIEFYGLKSLFMVIFAVGLLLLFAAFIGLYYAGIPRIPSLLSVTMAAMIWAVNVQRLSRRFGRYGLLKAYARRKLPDSVRIRDRRIFMDMSFNGEGR